MKKVITALSLSAAGTAVGILLGFGCIRLCGVFNVTVGYFEIPFIILVSIAAVFTFNRVPLSKKLSWLCAFVPAIMTNAVFSVRYGNFYGAAEPYDDMTGTLMTTYYSWSSSFTIIIYSALISAAVCVLTYLQKNNRSN